MRKLHINWISIVCGAWLLISGLTSCDLSDPIPGYVEITILATGDVNTKFEFTEFPGPIFYSPDLLPHQVGTVQLVSTTQSTNTGPSPEKSKASWLKWDYKEARAWWRTKNPDDVTTERPAKERQESVVVDEDTTASNLLYW